MKYIKWGLLAAAALVISGCHQPCANSCGGGCYKKGYKPVNVQVYQPYYYKAPGCCGGAYSY